VPRSAEPAVAADGPPRPAFILSTERSGSTLLRWLVDAHPEIASPGEILLARLCFDLFITVSRTVVAAPGPDDRIATNRAAVARVRAIVDGIMTEYAHARGARVWCDKTPHNLAHLNVLVDTYPDARYVCLYRDGLDVAHSCLEASREGFMAELVEYVRRSPHDLVGAMLDSWCEKTELLLKMELRHPQLCHRVRYEDLVARPETVLPPLFAFLGVAWDPAVLERAFTMEHDGGGGDPLIKDTRRVEADRVGRGRALDTSKLGLRQRGRVDSLLRNLGYATLDPPVA
jgi:protein-tyrosine sulfotransferase